MTKKLVEEIVQSVEENQNSYKPPLIVPTGSTILDLVVGGGFPFGKMINIIGDSSSGKTYLALEMLATTQKKYGNKLKWFYDSAEDGFSFDTDSMYGFSVLPEDNKRSFTIEEFGANLKTELNKIKDDEILIYILDSKERQAAIEAGKDYDKGSYKMEKQKFTSEFFRLRVNDIADKNCLLVILSQVRMKIDAMFGEKYSRSGGKALDFYSYINLWLSECQKQKQKDRVTSVTIKAKTKKAKIKTPFREGFIELVFDYGIDNVKGNINFLYDLKTPTGKNVDGYNKKKLEWDEEEYTVKKLIEHIESNDLETELENRVIQKWNDIEESIKTKGRKNKWTKLI
jgi:recombination protein RecA